MRIPVLIIFLVMSLPMLAQRSSVEEARTFLVDKDYKNALPLLNNAVKDAETKNDAEAWYLRGTAYLQQALENSTANPNALDEAYSSYKMALAIKSDYNAELNNGLYAVALLKFNAGVASYSAKSYGQAYDEFMAVNTINKIDGGKRFSDNKEMKALAVDARKNAAYAAMNAGRNKDAQPLLEDLIKNESKDDVNAYLSLIDIYGTEKNDAQQLSMIKAARAQFPDNEAFRNQEINYYIKKGNTEELLAKLEEAVKKDPNNAQLWFNLANSYFKMAYGADAEGKIKLAGNFSEVYYKAENAYKKAVQLSPDEVDFNYNFGILYYNYASWYTTQIRNTPDEKEAARLTNKRNEEFAKGKPFFEKSYMLLTGKGETMTPIEKATYLNSMIALKEIYSRNGEKEKQAEIEANMERWK
jgi:tetratricopeptide (TPR) repeat protein